MTSALYLALPLMVILVVLQSALLPRFPVFGVVPQLMFVATIAWALLRGLREGLVWAFIAGLFYDLFSAGPLGISSLSLMAAVAIAIYIQRSFPESRIILPIVLGAVTTVIFWAIYLLLLRIVMPLFLSNQTSLGITDLIDNPQVRNLISIIVSAYGLNRSTLAFIVPMALLHSLLILPIYWAFYAIERTISPAQVEI